jgi:hypothetical protein
MARGRPKKQPEQPPEQLRENSAVSVSEAAQSPLMNQEKENNMSDVESGTVIVGCKLPCGLVISHGGKSVELKGSRDARIINGFGLTSNVDAEFFNAWKKAHRDLAVVKNELIFAYGDMDSAEDMAEERYKEKTGLEGLNPDKPGKDLERVTEDEDED